MSTDRYITAIQAALDIQQKQIEIRQLHRTIAQNLTAYEVGRRDFDDDAARRAFKALSEPAKIAQCLFVKAKLEYKQVSISLHSDPIEEPGRINSGGASSAMKQVFSEIRVKDVVDS